MNKIYAAVHEERYNTQNEQLGKESTAYLSVPFQKKIKVHDDRNFRYFELDTQKDINLTKQGNELFLAV